MKLFVNEADSIETVSQLAGECQVPVGLMPVTLSSSSTKFPPHCIARKVMTWRLQKLWPQIK
jgi:hypothetical protein